MSSLSTHRELPRYFILLMAAIIALAPFSIDAYLPSFPAIAAEFGVDPVKVNYTMSAYLIGLALGQLLGGPISDQLGRRRIGFLGFAIFLAITLLILISHNLSQLVILRFFQAIGGGLVSSVVMPTIRDVSSPEKSASRMALVFLIMLLAPMVAPVIGVVLAHWDWRYIFVFLCLYSAIVFVLYGALVSETRQASHSRPDFGDIFQQYRRVIFHRMLNKQVSIRYGLSYSFSGCCMLIYLTNASFVFQTYFAVPDQWFPVLFGINVIAVAAMQSVSARYLRNKNLLQIVGYYRMGQRIQLAAAASLLAGVSLFDPPIWLFAIGLAIVLGCIGITSPSGNGLYLAGFKKLSGSAAAIVTVGTFGIGSLLGVVSGIFNTGDLVPLAGVLFTTSLIANLLLWSIRRNDERQILSELSAGNIEPL